MSFSPEDKIAQLEELLADDPADHLGFFMVGKLYLDTGRAAEAADRFAKCVALAPDYTAAWRFLGDAWRKAGDVEQARAAYTQGIVVGERIGDLQTVKEMQAFLRKL